MAEKVFKNRSKYSRLSSCTPKSATDACVKSMVSYYGWRLWRRPLTDAEVDRYVKVVGSQGQESAKLAQGMQYALAG